MDSGLRGNDKNKVFGEEMNMAKANAIVAQSGGPTCVINSSVCGVIQEAAKTKKIGRVLAAHDGILGVLKEELFDAR